MGQDRDLNQGSGSEPVGDRVRIFLRGRRWHGNYQLDGRQVRVSLKTTSKKEARRRAAGLEAELAAGRAGRPKPPAGLAVVINEYLDYLRTERRSPKTLSKYEKVCQRVTDLAARRRVRAIADLNLRLVRAYQAERVRSGAAPKTVYTESVVIRQLAKFAVSHGLVDTDPLKALKLTKPRPAPQPCWRRDQVERILAVSPEWLRPSLTLLAELGLRIGELKWLTWDDVDPRPRLRPCLRQGRLEAENRRPSGGAPQPSRAGRARGAAAPGSLGGHRSEQGTGLGSAGVRAPTAGGR